MSEICLHTENLAVGYSGRALITGIDLTLRQGRIMTLIGPNGAGKSTILKSIIRQLALLGGAVYLDGRDMAGLSEPEMARQLSVMMTGQIHPELMTCFDVAATGRYPYTGRLGILSKTDIAKVEECLALVHASELADRDFSRISDGQRQRVLLARALCQEPDVLVLDEPTSFLDIRHKLELLAILKDMVRARRLAVVMSLHELDLAQKVSDWVVCVHGDKIDRQGPPEEIFTAEYVMSLYSAARGSYNPLFGSLELEPAEGKPEVFVIGGGGAGIPVYRRLQREGVPFAAGVIGENDVDFPVAQALAVEVVAEKAFEPVGEEAYRRARELMGQCGRVLCPVTAFGPVNERNRRLLEQASREGKLAVLPDGAGRARCQCATRCPTGERGAQ